MSFSLDDIDDLDKWTGWTLGFGRAFVLLALKGD
jgi:hypothetical protein